METPNREPESTKGSKSGLRRLLTALAPTGDADNRARARSTLRGVLLFFAAWLNSAVPLAFSVNPLGLSLLCAAEENLGWIFAGVLLGSRTSPRSLLISAVSATIVLLLRLLFRFRPGAGTSPERLPAQEIRRLYRDRVRERIKTAFHGEAARESSAATVPAPLPPVFDEPVAFRVLAGTIVAALIGICESVIGGFALFDLWGAALRLFLLPVAVLLYADFWRKSGGDPSSSRLPLRRLISLAALIIPSLYCSRSLVFLGLIPATVALTALTFCATHRYGFSVGAVVALLGGLVSAPAAIPVYLLPAILYSFLRPSIGTLALLPAALTSFAYLLLVPGTQSFLILFPSITAGVLIFSVYARIRFPHAEDTSPDDLRESVAQDPTNLYLWEQNRSAALSARISAVAGSFSGLSEVFRQLGDCQRTPSRSDLRELCDECFDRYCPDCPGRETCWGEKFSDTLTSVNRLCDALAAERTVTQSDLTDDLRRRCPHTGAVLSDINYQFSRRTYEQLHGEKNDAFAQFYDAVAHLARDVLRDVRQSDDYEPLGEETAALVAYLTEQNVSFRHALVSGKVRRLVQISGCSPDALGKSKEDFCRDVGALCGARFTDLRFDAADDGMIVLRAVPPLRARFVHCSIAANDADAAQSKRVVCGDSLRLFEDGSGRFFALLCDGMGQGRRAALTSSICAIFLERVLRAGVSVDTALRMLNHYLRARAVSPADECTSTVDLFILDLFLGKAQLIKSGAAASFIRRGKNVFRFGARTLPIGILDVVDTKVFSAKIVPGDRIVLLSDGICEAGGEAGDGEAEWLGEYLGGDLPEDDHLLMDDLFRQARGHGSRDDMSVICIRIEKAS